MRERGVAPPNHITVPAPTTPGVVQAAFVRWLLDANRTEDGLLKLSATLARHLLGYLSRREDLTPEDRDLVARLQAFTQAWAKQERAAWRALTFHRARERRTRAPARTEDRRPETKPREPRATRRARVATRDGPASGEDDPDDPPPPERDLDALRGFRVASSRMHVHVGRRLGAARTA
jgi:hypothetical protein